MDKTITSKEAVDQMNSFYQRKKYAELKSLSENFTLTLPYLNEGWLMLGLAKLFTEGRGREELIKASSLGCCDSDSWINILDQFAKHPNDRPITANDLIQQHQFEKIRKSEYLNYPAEIHLETQAVCNAACTFCPYPTMARKGDKMSDDLIRKIIEDLKAIPPHLPFHISPFKVSDPFLDKRIFDICNQITSSLPNAHLRLFTNGSPLTDNMITKIQSLERVKHLWISLNDSDEVRYEELMGLPFRRTVDNLDRLHEFVKAGEFTHKVEISRVMDESAADSEFKQFVTERYPLFDCILTRRSEWVGQVDIEKISSVPSHGCVRWFELSIMASGEVALCCMDGEGEYVIGDVSKENTLDVYNSSSYKKMRQYMTTRLSAAHPCDTCTL